MNVYIFIYIYLRIYIPIFVDFFEDSLFFKVGSGKLPPCRDLFVDSLN